MIFSELYSVSYHTVARVLETAFDSPASEKELQHAYNPSGAEIRKVAAAEPGFVSGSAPSSDDASDSAGEAVAESNRG